MDKDVYRVINFDSIILGTLISADCGGILQCSTTEQAFQLIFHSEKQEEFSFIIDIVDVRKIFKSVKDSLIILDFKLKPAKIKSVGDLIRSKDYFYQISKISDESKFQIYLNDITNEDVAFIEKFFASIDIFDGDVGKVEKEQQDPEPHHQQSSKVHKPNLIKHRKKKHHDIDPEDGSQDYHPQKRPRKQSFSKTNADCEVIEEIPKRSLRVRNRDDVNLCEDMSEEAQLQEALKRSLKGVDQTVIESLSHIEDSKSEQDMEHVEIYDNIDKTIELFTYSTSNGDIIVRMEDYLCLSRNEYLSDVIIDFYLQYIYNEKMTAEQREKTLIIGTHFYTLYATSSEYSGWNDGLNAGLNAKEKRYRRIDGILRDDVNIFDKDYIIMPLMDHSHWFLAIVCFPKLNGSYTIDGNEKVDDNDVKRNPKKSFQPAIKSSCILIFDSVKGNGSRRTVAINHIKNFLEYEWMNKYREEFHFDVKCLNGHSPKVPLQLNNVDCGCFILEFMERFFVSSPLEDLRFPIDLGDWFSPEVVRSSKRRELADVIQDIMKASNNQVELPKIRFYGDRKRKTSKSVQIVDLDSSMENNNGLIDETFHGSENGNGNTDENGNNNDENFNNNNDFNCLDSNNSLQNGNMMNENQQAVHSIMRDEGIEDPIVERVTTQELMEYQQDYVDEMLNGGMADSAGYTSDEMNVDEIPSAENDQDSQTEDLIGKNEAENGIKVAEIIKSPQTSQVAAKLTEKNSDIEIENAEVLEKDAKVTNNDAELKEIDAEADAKVQTDAKIQNDAEMDAEMYAKIQNDAEMDAEMYAKIQTDAEMDAKVQTDAEMDAKVQTDAEIDAKIQTDAEMDAKIQNNTEVDAKIQIDAEVDEKIQTEAVMDAKIQTDAEMDAKVQTDAEMDAKIETDAEMNAKIQTDAEMDAKIQNNTEIDTKVQSDAKNDAKVQSDAEDDANHSKSDPKTNTSIKKHNSDSDIEEIHITPEKIDLTQDDEDFDEIKSVYGKNSDIKIDKINLDPIVDTQQNNDQIAPENAKNEEDEKNQKSGTMQSIADRISQSINLKESSTIVLLD